MNHHMTTIMSKILLLTNYQPRGDIPEYLVGTFLEMLTLVFD